MSHEACPFGLSLSVKASGMTSFKKRSLDGLRHVDKWLEDVFHNAKQSTLAVSQKIRKRLLEMLHHSKTWSRIITVFSILAEAANIGIVLEIVARWVPAFASLASSGPIAHLMLISDPLIYCFRAAIRLARLIGRHAFHIAFEEEKHATKKELKKQTIGDIASLVFFGLAITFFVGVVAAPVGITLAWLMGLMGLGVVGYFDYYLPEKRAKIHFQDVKNEKKHTPEEIDFLQKQYTKKRNAMRLYVALLFGLSLLLICGSAAAFAPPLLVPILVIASKVASIFLGTIACGRFLNWCFKPKEKNGRGLITMSIHPELMRIDDLKALLGNKPSYALWNGSVYYIDEHWDCEYLPIIHGDANEIKAMFPSIIGKVQNASTEQLLKLTYLTSHTRKEKPAVLTLAITTAAIELPVALVEEEVSSVVGQPLASISVAAALTKHGQFSTSSSSSQLLSDDNEPEVSSHLLPV